VLTIPKYPVILTPMSPSDSSSVLPQAASPGLILASASRIRLALLRAAGLQVTARPADIDEKLVKQAARAEGAGPDRTALLLADLKARHAPQPDAIVIGADQLLVCEGQWFDKPADIAQARRHLLALRGRSHELHTAISLHYQGRTLWQHVARPRLTMRAFSDEMLDAYLVLEGEHVLSSVGAYRLEGPGMQLFTEVEGEHAAILGLPLLALLGFLREHGLLLH
jgi:septum formation protein